jgi:hypothetical protein
LGRGVKPPPLNLKGSIMELLRNPYLSDSVYLKELGNDEGVLSGSWTQNNIPIIEDNYVRKCNANNGFSEKRMFRRIASIPIIAHIEAHRQGYDLDNVKDLRRFLSENPDYMSVEKIDSGRDPRIIIK